MMTSKQLRAPTAYLLKLTNLPTAKYNQLLNDNITKAYTKAITKKLEIDDRGVYCS